MWAAVCALILGGPRNAAAATAEDSARAGELMAQAERDDAALALGAALAGYDEALRLDPSMAKAMRAQQRGATLRARAEGAFGPLAALEKVRRDPSLSSDPQTIDALVRAADGFPPGLVRVETWILAAEAYANRLGRPDDALPLWRRIATDPHADKVVAAAAARALANHQLARGDYHGAESTLALEAAGGKVGSDIRRALRRHDLHRVAVLTIGVAGVLALIAFLRAARAGKLGAAMKRARADGRLVVAYAAYVAIAGALLASGYEDGTARPFLLFGAVLVPLLLVARTWGAAGSPARSARIARAALCASSAIGAAFLVLEHVDVGYLEGLGL